MAFLRLTDAQTAYKHQLNQDDVRQLRDNQDDHEARIAQFLAANRHSIIEDFFASKGSGGAQAWIDTSLYSQVGAGTGLISLMDTTGEHVMQMTTISAASTVGIRAAVTRCALRFNQDMAVFMEIRAKDPGGTAMANILFGFQDIGDTGPADESDCIGFLKGTTAGKWRFRVATGGVATQTDNIGNRATWQKLRLELLRSGGGSTLQVRAYIDGSEISGSPFTTNIPTSVVMTPYLGAVGPASGTTDLRVDRWETRWTDIPVAA